jgi:DNA-binding NtrC family response regulator
VGQKQQVKTIMIIEDEEDILLVYRDYLGKRGFRIEVSAPTANEVLRDYDAYRPDLVIIDYRLPGSMNGLEAAEKILRTNPSAKVLVITAYDNVKREMEENEFLRDKGVMVMIKPVQLARLAKIISAL